MSTFISNFRSQKINLTEEELNRLNLIENKKIRNSCMSLYTSLIIQNLNKNKKLEDLNLSNLKKDKLKYSISLKKLREKYNKNHNPISIRTLLNRVNKLKEIGLLFIDKIKRKNIYSFFRYLTVNKKVNEKLHEKKSTKPTGNTNFKSNVKILKAKSFKITKDLDSNSNNITPVIDNFDYEEYLEKNKKCSFDYASNLLNKAFKLKKIKSYKIKSYVIAKIVKYYSYITKKHAMKYICSVIDTAKEGYYNNYKKFNEIKKVDHFNNFEQREYDFKNLENKLLGWTR